MVGSVHVQKSSFSKSDFIERQLSKSFDKSTFIYEFVLTGREIVL